MPAESPQLSTRRIRMSSIRRPRQRQWARSRKRFAAIREHGGAAIRWFPSAPTAVTREITAEHALELCEGRGTPFEKLYDLDAWTLLLGVGFNRCTSLHYAESLVPNRRTMISRFPLVENGVRVSVEKLSMGTDNGTHFPSSASASSIAARCAPAKQATPMRCSSRPGHWSISPQVTSASCLHPLKRC
jgi:hypothetical protein